MIMEEADPNVGALAGGGAPDPTPTPEPTPGEPAPSIWDGIDVKLPEGLDDGTRESTFLKPFVDKESGEVNYGNLMKSYVHSQKSMNSSKVVIPGENASPEELDEFHSKLGYVSDEGEYKLDRAEESVLSEEQVADVKKFAREHRMPVKQAQALVNYMESKTSESVKMSTEATASQITEGLNGLKTEWGQAYEQKLGNAQRVLTEVVADESVMEVFKDPRVGSNPAVIKALAKIGEGLFKEDGIKGQAAGAMSPSEAQAEINKIMDDPRYWDKNNPSQKDLVAKTMKLREMIKG